MHVGRGSVIIEKPADGVREALVRWCADGGDGLQGRYEPMYHMSHGVLVTMPGFAARVARLILEHHRGTVLDERAPMPEPDVEAATGGGGAGFGGFIELALKAGGGVATLPHALGTARFAAALSRAWPRDALVERRTPLAVVATTDADKARSIYREMRSLLPGREIGLSLSTLTDSEDIVVTTYSSLDRLHAVNAGLFVGDDIDGIGGRSLASVLERVSMVRNAARFGVCASDDGRARKHDIVVEGLFGEGIGGVSYADAVLHGQAAPVTVCWLPAVRPEAPLLSAPYAVLSDIALGGDGFARQVAWLVDKIPGDTGCLLCSESDGLVRRVAALANGMAVTFGRGVTKREVTAMLDNLARGTLRKAAVAAGPSRIDSDARVVISATCGGRESAAVRIPWRPPEGGGRNYIVEFRHPWDMHNGRPGVLAMRDAARAAAYRELGFLQMSVDDAGGLPFL